MALTRAMKYFGDGDVVAAAAGAEFSGAGVDGTSRRRQTPRTGRSAGLNALETRLQLSHLQGQKDICQTCQKGLKVTQNDSFQKSSSQFFPLFRLSSEGSSTAKSRR